MCTVQTAVSYTHLDVYKRQVLDSGFWQRMRLEHWVKAGLVDAVSSDAHNCTSRPTRMRQAYERLCTRVGQTTAQKLTGLDGTE